MRLAAALAVSCSIMWQLIVKCLPRCTNAVRSVKAGFIMYLQHRVCRSTLARFSAFSVSVNQEVQCAYLIQQSEHKHGCLSVVKLHGVRSGHLHRPIGVNHGVLGLRPPDFVMWFVGFP